MKKTISIFLLIMLCYYFKASAQQDNVMVLNPSLDKFVGTWRYINGADTIIFKLRKSNIRRPGTHMKVDNIYGYHSYVSGNTIIESSMNHSNQNYSSGFSTVFGGNNNKNDKDTLFCIMDDISKRKKNYFELVIDTVLNKITFKRIESAGGMTYHKPGFPPIQGYTLPENFSMFKVIPPVANGD